MDLDEHSDWKYSRLSDKDLRRDNLRYEVRDFEGNIVKYTYYDPDLRVIIAQAEWDAWCWKRTSGGRGAFVANSRRKAIRRWPGHGQPSKREYRRRQRQGLGGWPRQLDYPLTCSLGVRLMAAKAVQRTGPRKGMFSSGLRRGAECSIATKTWSIIEIEAPEARISSS